MDPRGAQGALMGESIWASRVSESFIFARFYKGFLDREQLAIKKRKVL